MGTSDEERTRAVPVRGDEDVTHRIVDAVAAYSDVPSTDLPPLFEVVDPDALDALFASPSNGPTRSDGSVSFRYFEHRVTLSADDTIFVEPPGDT